MLKYSLFLMLMLVTSLSYSQEDSKSKAIDALLEENKARENTEQIMLGLIRSYVNKKPNAPKSLEQEILKSLDWKSYMAKVKAAYAKAYTEEEIKELTELHRSGKMEQYKQKSERVSQALYDIGSEFGRESVKVIQQKLQGY